MWTLKCLSWFFLLRFFFNVGFRHTKEGAGNGETPVSKENELYLYIASRCLRETGLFASNGNYPCLDHLLLVRRTEGFVFTIRVEKMHN